MEDNTEYTNNRVAEALIWGRGVRHRNTSLLPRWKQSHCLPWRSSGATPEQQDGRASVPTSRFNHCRAALLFTLASIAGQGEKNSTATPQTKRHHHALLVEIVEVGGTTSRFCRRSKRQVDPHLELLEI
jgi:hypothetical protein